MVLVFMSRPRRSSHFMVLNSPVTRRPERATTSTWSRAPPSLVRHLARALACTCRQEAVQARSPLRCQAAPARPTAPRTPRIVPSAEPTRTSRASPRTPTASIALAAWLSPMPAPTRACMTSWLTASIIPRHSRLHCRRYSRHRCRRLGRARCRRHSQAQYRPGGQA